MKLVVGTGNKVKLDAVREVLAEIERFKDVEIIGVNVPSGVSEQPMDLNETIDGAINRAKAAFEHGDFGMGIESGLMDFPQATTKRMNLTVCAIHDGETTHLSTSSGFETPNDINTYLEQGYDLDQASMMAGYTDLPNVGKFQGIIGILSEGRITRKDYTKTCIETAILHIRF